MEDQITKPSKRDRMIADESFHLLKSSLHKLKSDIPEIEIEEAGEKIRIPKSALELLAKILEEMKKGKPRSLVPVAAEVTT